MSEVPVGTHELLDVSYGLDGCFGLQLADAPTWYVCMPDTVMPFVVGDVLDLQVPGQHIVVRAEATEDLPARSLWLLTGRAVEQPIDGLDVDLAAIPLFDCDLQPHAACGTVTRNVKIGAVTALGELELRAGDPAATLMAVDG
jgi:hypothetical protein